MLIYSFNTKTSSTLSEGGHLLRHKAQMDVLWLDMKLNFKPSHLRVGVRKAAVLRCRRECSGIRFALMKLIKMRFIPSHEYRQLRCQRQIKPTDEMMVKMDFKRLHVGFYNKAAETMTTLIRPPSRRPCSPHQCMQWVESAEQCLSLKNFFPIANCPTMTRWLLMRYSFLYTSSVGSRLLTNGTVICFSVFQRLRPPGKRVEPR